jgi:hypothetical protein
MSKIKTDTIKETAVGVCATCGAKQKRCHGCGQLYCPECDQYHLEECRHGRQP